MIGGEGLGSTEKQLEPGLRKYRDAAAGPLEMGLHAVPVRWYFAEGKICRNTGDVPGACSVLEDADHDLAGFLADIGAAPRVAQDRQPRMHARDRLGDEVVVLGGLQRHLDTRESPDRSSPNAAAIHDDVGDDSPKRTLHRGHPAILLFNALDRTVLEYRDAGLTCSLGERPRDIGRVDAPVAREVKGGLHVPEVRERPKALHIGDTDLLALDAPALRGALPAAHLLDFGRREGELNRSALDEAGRLAGLLLETPVELLRVRGQPGLRLGIPERGEEPRRMPGSAGGELLTLE